MTVNITCSIKIISVQPHNKWDTGQQHVDQHYSSGAKAEQRKQSRTLCASTLQHCNQKKPASDCIHTNKLIYFFLFFVPDAVAMFVGFAIEDFSFCVLLLAMCSQVGSLFK
jgi:hypothetical protein